MAEPELLDLIDQLTKPDHVHITRNGERVVRTDAALIEQLHNAVVGNVGGTGGPSRAARERTPLDITAFTLLEQIDGRARSWCAELDGDDKGDLTDVLRRWYSLWDRYPRQEVDTRRRTAIVGGWVTQITDIIDPPTKLEITSRCPECGQRWVTRGVGSDAESVGALTAILRDGTEFEASCAGCGHRWVGVSRMRQLRIAIDESEKDSATA